MCSDSLSLLSLPLPSPLSPLPSPLSSLPSPLSSLPSPLLRPPQPCLPTVRSRGRIPLHDPSASPTVCVVGLTPTSPHLRPGTIAMALHHGVVPRGEGHEEVAAGNTRSGKAHACTPASAARVRVLQPAPERHTCSADPSSAAFHCAQLCSYPPRPHAVLRLHCATPVSTPLMVAYSAA